MIEIVQRRKISVGNSDKHINAWCLDAPATAYGEPLSGYVYLVKGLVEDKAGKGWWWCEACLRKRGVLW
jgi:hypothetical protein